MKPPLSIEEIAYRLQAKGYRCTIDLKRYFPLIVYAPKCPIRLAGFLFERGEWRYRLNFDDWLKAANVRKKWIEQDFSEAVEARPPAQEQSTQNTDGRPVR